MCIFLLDGIPVARLTITEHGSRVSACQTLQKRSHNLQKELSRGRWALKIYVMSLPVTSYEVTSEEKTAIKRGCGSTIEPLSTWPFEVVEFVNHRQT